MNLDPIATPLKDCLASALPQWEMFCTDRDRFYEMYGRGSDIEKLIRSEIFYAKTRPDMLEKVAANVLGLKHYDKKKGFDGYDTANNIEIEIKAKSILTLDVGYKTTGVDKGRLKKAKWDTSVSDPTYNTLEKADKAKPDYIFSYFIDGYYAVAFRVKWEHIRPIYTRGLTKMKDQTISDSKSITRAVGFSLNEWLELSEVEWVYPGEKILSILPLHIYNHIKFQRGKFLEF